MSNFWFINNSYLRKSFGCSGRRWIGRKLLRLMRGVKGCRVEISFQYNDKKFERKDGKMYLMNSCNQYLISWKTDFSISSIVTLWAHRPMLHTSITSALGKKFIRRSISIPDGMASVLYLSNDSQRIWKTFPSSFSSHIEINIHSLAHWIDPSFHPSKLASHPSIAFLHCCYSSVPLSSPVSERRHKWRIFPQPLQSLVYIQKKTFYFLMSCK